MDDIDSRLDELRKELGAARAQSQALADRLGGGDVSARNDLNVAIRRQNELQSAILDLEKSSGRYVRMSAPAPMYGPPPHRFGPFSSGARGLLSRMFRRK